MAVEEGKAAPLFTLKDQTGGKVSLKDLRGQNVIVYFYPKDDTPGCTKQANGCTALDKEFKKLNTLVLGVSPDDEASHDKFICKYNIPYTLLCDTDKKVMTKYGAYGEKMMYGKKTIGVIRSTVWVDEKGKVKRHWRRVPKAADHPQKVLEAIQAATD